MDYELSRAYPDVWEAMETLVSRGKVKSIGTSAKLRDVGHLSWTLTNKVYPILTS